MTDPLSPASAAAARFPLPELTDEARLAAAAAGRTAPVMPTAAPSVAPPAPPPVPPVTPPVASMPQPKAAGGIKVNRAGTIGVAFAALTALAAGGAWLWNKNQSKPSEPIPVTQASSTSIARTHLQAFFANQRLWTDLERTTGMNVVEVTNLTRQISTPQGQKELEDNFKSESFKTGKTQMVLKSKLDDGGESRLEISANGFSMVANHADGQKKTYRQAWTADMQAMLTGKHKVYQSPTPSPNAAHPS